MKKIIFLFISIIFTITSVFSQWTQKADFGGTARRGAVGFTIGTKLYIGTGFDGTLYKDFWEYDLDNNTWTQKADFGGIARWDAVGFSIGTKGYIGTGYTGTTFKKDFWEYDPDNNTWTQKTNFGGPVRRSAVGFSIGTKGYIGTGYGTPAGTYYKDFWEYDPDNDVWTQKMDFGGTARDGAVGFFISSKGYIGTGQDINDNYYKDFWEYDPGSNTWTQKANFGGTARTSVVGFSIGTKGYIGTGEDGTFPYTKHKDFWEYDPGSNTWTQKVDFGGTARWEAVGFSTGSKGYIGTGHDDTSYTIDFWEYNPTPNFIMEITDDFGIQLYPNPTNDILFIELIDYKNTRVEFINMEGQSMKSFYLQSSKILIDINNLVSGIYFVKIINEKGITIKKIIKLK
jgi:N-acetylneuraminic acid mutarotase